MTIRSLSPPAGSITMSWVARVPLDHADAVALLRNEPGLIACECDAFFWIRSASPTSALKDELAQRLRKEAVAELLHVTATGTVIPWGKRVPIGQLPSGPWLPLPELFTPVAPLAGYAAQRPAPATITMVPSETIVAPTLLRLPLAEWNAYVRTAPNLRLARWEFAANTTGDVLIRGTPLPPIHGQHYWEADGLFVPCGWMWSPAVSADIMRTVLRLESGTFALVDVTTSTWEIIPPEAFVPARRQNVRRTVIERTLQSETST